MNYLRMENLDLGGKRVLIREDLNVPVSEGRVTSDARIRAALPTIKAALDKGAAVMVMSHLGRPVEGEFDPEFSMQPVADRLGELLGREVRLQENWLDGVDVAPGEIVLCDFGGTWIGEDGIGYGDGDDATLLGDISALVESVAPDLIITHGNGPQVGVLAMESAADPMLSRPYPLDPLGVRQPRDRHRQASSSPSWSTRCSRTGDAWTRQRCESSARS